MNMIRISYPVKYIKLCIILSAVFWPVLSVRGQSTGDPKEGFLYGEYYIVQGLFHKALPYFHSALETDPDNANLNYRVGQCYINILGEQHLALFYLQKAVKEINPRYIPNRYKSTGAPVEAWLLLGDAYHRKNLLLEASHAYHEYRRLAGASGTENHKHIMRRISGLGISYEIQRDRKDVTMINMGDVINSRFSDYNPVLSGDQNTLIYTQYWESNERIMITHRSKTGWTEPKDISNELGADGNCYSSALSFDGTELFLVCHDEFGYDIYSSTLTENGWTEKTYLPGRVNSKFNESSVAISASGEELYFASNRPGGLGGFDLYKAERTGAGWSNITNLGNVINSKGDEEAPFITFDGSHLFFSSNGHETVGNMDIMFSVRDSAGNWMAPINIGVPVNTTGDDLFFVYFNNTYTGYLSRDLTDGYGKHDLYQVQLGTLDVLPPPVMDSFTLLDDGYDLIGVSDDMQLEIALSDEGVFQIEADYNYIENMFYQRPPGGETGTVISDDTLPERERIFTVQILALSRMIDLNKIKLTPVKVSVGNDKLYRYTVGELKDFEKAMELLENIKEAGYFDAFIRDITSVENYPY